jgi:hypothetical protein
LTQADIIVFMSDGDEYDSSKESPFVDGWRNDMRLQGGYDSYEIRSAGPDEVFDTEDDIYLAGDWDSEHIIDGVKESYTPARELVEGTGRVAFQEPNGYYRIALPGKHSIITSYSGWRSVATFRYNSSNSVSISSEPSPGRWAPEQEMSNRVRLIENGADDEFAGFEIVESGLSTLQGANGFELLLRRDDVDARLIEVASRDGLQYSISIVATGEDREYVMDKLTAAIRSNFVPR